MPLRGRPRLRRLAGIAGTTALILALFVAFLLVTPWGLTLGLRILSSALHGTVLAGHISFGDVDGGLLTGFRIDDVEMTDGRGEPLLRIDALEVDVAVRPLWDGRVEVERLRLASPVVWVDTSTPGTGWSTLAAPTDEPETPEPTVGPPTVGPPFPLAASIELSDATLIWVDEANPNGRERVRSLDVDASARYEAPAWDFEIASLRGEAEGQSVRIAAEARMTPVALVLSTVGLELAGATADASGRIELGGGLSALAEARVPPRWPLLPPDVLPRGGRARVDAQIGEDGHILGSVTVESEGSKADARIDFSPPDATAEVEVVLQPLALRDVFASAPAGTLRGRARASAGWGELSDLTSIDGRFETSLAGEFEAGPGFRGFSAKGRLRGGRARTRVTLDMPQARLDLRARGRVAPRVAPELLVLTATVPEIRALLPDAPDVQGGVQLSVRGTGDRGGWKARFDATATEPEAGPWSARTVTLTATATGAGLELKRAETRVVALRNELGPQRMGRVEIRAQRPAPKRASFEIDAVGGEPIEALRLRGSVTATSGVALRIGGGALELAEATWTLAPFRAQFDEGLLVWEAFEATSELGFLESSGRLRAEPRGGSIELRAQIDDLGALPFMPVDQGSIGVSSQLSWDAAAIRGRLDARAEALTLQPIAQPLSAEAHVEAGDLVRAQATFGVPEGGTLELEVEVAPPAPWTDGPAWLDWDRLKTARLELDEVALAKWLAADVDADGRLRGALAYDRDQRELDMSLTARDVRAPGVEVPIEFSVRGGVDDEGTRLSVDGELDDQKAIRLRGRAGVERDELPRIDELEFGNRKWDLEGELPPLPLSLVAKAAGLPRDWVETATGAVSVSFAANSHPKWRARLTARAHGEIRSGAPVLDAGVDVDLAADGLVATASVTGAGFGTAKASYRVDASPGGGGDETIGVLQRWSQGRFEASVQQLALTGIRSLVVLPADLRGRVDGHATWDLEADDGSIAVAIPELTVDEYLAPLAVGLNATWTSTGTQAVLRLTPDDAAESLTASVQLSDGLRAALAQPGAVGVRGGWGLDDLNPGVLIREPLDRRRFAGRLSTTGTVAGTLGTPEVAGALRWENARIGRQSFDRFHISGEMSPRRTRAVVDLRESEGGQLRVEAGETSSEAREDEPGLHVSASRFSIDFLADLAALTTGATVQVEGMLSADLHVVGTDDPRLRGGLTLSDVRVVMPGAIPRLNDTRVEVSTKGRNVEIDLAGRSGANGRLELQSQIDLSNFRTPVLSGSISGRSVEFLAGILPLEINFDIDLDGRSVEEHFELDVTIRNSTILVTERNIESTYAPIQPTPDVVRVETFGVRPIEVSAVTPSIASDPLQLVVRVRNADPINFRGKDAQGVIRMDIRVDVRSSTTRVSGTTNIGDGTIALFGREYRVVQAVVAFTERSPPNPQLDVQLTHAFDTLTLTVLITGRAQSPNVRFTSDPGTYDESQLLSFFAGLANPDQEGPAGPAGEQAAGAAAGLLLGPVTKEVRKNLPIDTFDVSMGNNAPVVTVGKWLSEELFVAYTWTTQAEPTEDEQSGLVRWRFYPGWVLEVIAGPIQQSADIFWIRRF